jgi:hypothetical protein
MFKRNLKQPISIAITESEAELVEKLTAKGIKIIMIFRRGLEAYEKDLQNT